MRQRFGGETMRKVIEPQMEIGEISIPDVQIDLTSRDEIPKLLIGLQELYRDQSLRKKVFEALKDLIRPDINPNRGRKGMNLWTILVLGVLRLNCNWDFDKLVEIANNHLTLRLMLGHSPFGEPFRYALQTVKDNIKLFTPEILDKINQIVVHHGHEVIGDVHELYGSCDSSVVETDVHFPTDISVLLDALRKAILIIMVLCRENGITGWRKGMFNFRKIKRLFTQIRRMKHSSSKNPEKREERNQLIIKAHGLYLDLAQAIVDKAKEAIILLSSAGVDVTTQLKIDEIWQFIAHAERQIDQIRRRVVEGQTIPHHEKVFSIFEEHTKWIVKGKAGVPQQLGLNVCFVKDQFGFILHYRVMENETDVQIAVPIIEETQQRFENFKGCSFDKGFHSPANQEKLAETLESVVLPRKGKLSAVNREIESAEAFKSARRQHAAVESSINALQNHGLDRCPDHGLDGFKRYVGLAVLGRNIQILGHIIQQKKLKKQQRIRKKGLRNLRRQRNKATPKPTEQKHTCQLPLL